MHNLTKIKIFRILLWITYPLSILFLYPVVLLKRKRTPPLFFFFDRYAIGGGQRVYLDILESVRDIQKTVLFTRKSPNDKLKHEFYSFPNTECRDIHFWCDNLLFRLFTVHYFSFFVNRHHKARVLSSNSTFFYDMLPFLGRSVRKMELLHNFSYGKKGMEFFGLANYKHLDQRLVIDAVTRQNIIEQYRQYEIDPEYDRRISLIEFGVIIPAITIKTNIPPLKILYAGRGTPQKRIWLLNEIAEYFIKKNARVEFLFAGSMEKELSETVKSNSRVYGEIGDRETLNSLYRQAHVIILTSAFEGFPVVIKEGMSYGCIPVVTALPGNKIHLRHLENAILINDPENERMVVKNAIENIELLLDNPEMIKGISENTFRYALDHFGRKDFLISYHQLLA